MTEEIRLSELVYHIQETIQEQFEGGTYWISTQITNVKRYEGNRRCYLTLEEYEDGEKKAEVKGVFWASSYHEIEKFEKATQQPFKNGIEITCRVRVRFHPVYGLNFDILQIDIAHTVGSLELERQKTIDRLLKENPTTIQLFDGVFRTYNNRLPLPLVLKRIALITAPNSDGQRDFKEELSKNKHGYQFSVAEFLTTIQGDNAHQFILEKLHTIEAQSHLFDAVVIVRGGGSQTDFKPFDDYELCRCVANFPIPIFTGIGHDRNQSIIDLMAREQKTPTKVASLLVDHNFEFENRLIDLKTTFNELVTERIERAREKIENARRIVKLSSPQSIVNRGFAIITQHGKIVTNPASINEGTEILTMLRDELIYSTITKKTRNAKGFELP